MNNISIFDKLPSLSTHDNILLLTHTDMDGSGPAILLRMIFDNLTIMHCHNNIMSEMIKTNITDNEYADRYDKIIACDISCSDIDAEIIDAHENNKKFILLDHHKTAFDLNKYDWAVVETDYVQGSMRYDVARLRDATHSSGTSLMFDYLCHKTDENGICLIDYAKRKSSIDTIKEFVNTVTEYDTWDWVNVFNKKPICEKLSTLFSIYRSEIFERIMTEHLCDNIIISEQDMTLLDIEDSKIDEHLKCVQKYLREATLTLDTIDGEMTYSMIYCISNKYMPQTFDLMKQLYPAAHIYVINHGLGISIRSIRSDIDVSHIASMFGGGGHVGAGGFSISADKQREYLESAFSTNDIKAHIKDLT